MAEDNASEALGLERRLIFENYINGVDIEDLKAPFCRSADEITKEIFFVARKITEYRFRRLSDGSKHAAPLVPCSSLLDIRLNSTTLRETLGKCGDIYLSSEILIPKITLQKIDSPEMVEGVSNRINHSR